eukprot:scaffold188651_cov99-Cyclotella_meneghiniana.AAC.1
MAKNSNFPTVIKRSRHIHAGERCRREMYGMQYKRKKEPSLANDINKIYELFKHVGVFQSPNVSSELGDNTFWKRVLVETSKSKTPVEWHRSKQDVLVSPKEAKVLEVIWDKNVLRPSEKNVVKKDDYISASDDNSTISANGSIKSVLSVGTVDDLVEEQVRDMSDIMGMLNSVDANLEATSNNLSDETVFTAARAIANDEDPEVDEEMAKDDILKKLSNVTKYKMNMDCLSDPFSVGRTKLKNVKSDRDEELALFERKKYVITLCLGWSIVKPVNSTCFLYHIMHIWDRTITITLLVTFARHSAMCRSRTWHTPNINKQWVSIILRTEARHQKHLQHKTTISSERHK